MTSEIQVKEFWQWFSTHASEFGDRFENKALLRQLDELVAGLGDFAWEVGPGTNTENAFILSPAGNRDRLPIAAAIVAMAPDIPRWEFHSAKPAKHWEGRFELQDPNGEFLEIDATDWRCVLLRYADGIHEVVVNAPNLRMLPEDYQQWAVEIAMDILLGERRRLDLIDEVTVVSEFSDREHMASFLVSDIPNRIK